MRETLTRVGAQREDARRWAVRLEGMLRFAQATLASRTLLMRRAEADRDRALQRLASASTEVAAYREQRDEAVAALAELVEAVAAVQLSDLPHEEIVAAVGLPLPLGRRLVERYRRRVVPPDAHETSASGTMATG